MSVLSRAWLFGADTWRPATTADLMIDENRNLAADMGAVSFTTTGAPAWRDRQEAYWTARADGYLLRGVAY